MGNTYEVTVWRNEEPFGYRAFEYWRGEWAIVALYQLWKARRTGTGCATLHWR